VAVKVIRPELADEPGYRERFAREARAAMSVSGVYTASVVDSDTAGELPYLATEYVPAPALNEVVQATGPLPEMTVRALGAGLAEALAAIHRAGLVHRDLKPHNVLLAQNGPVVIDFGIARAGMETSLTTAESTIGTPGYIAPEVLHGQAPSPATDVFSLACVLVFAARGVGPYGLGEPLIVTYRIAHEEPDLSDLPESIKFLVQPALNRDPSRRPTPSQLLEEATRLGGVTLHDGLWLPDEVRTLLEDRRREVQALLQESAAATEAEKGPAAVAWQLPAQYAQAQTPAAFQTPTPTPTPASAQASTPPASPIGTWRAATSTEAGYHPDGPTPIPGNAFNGQTPPPLPPQPVTRRRRSVFAYGTAAAAVVVIAVVALVVLHTNGSSPSGQASSQSSSNSAPPSASASTAGTASATATSTASATSTANAAAVLNYRPGTYQVNQIAATDLLGNTVTVGSVTVADNHSVSVKLIYTNNSGSATQWSCAGSTVGEATLNTASGGQISSSSSDCTQDPSKTWNMPAGGTVDSVEYFASAPPGTGDWNFAIDSEPEFVGSTQQGFTIPTS